MMATFLLEIGTEELPSRFLSSNEQELVGRFEAGLKEADLPYDRMTVCSTPRRAVLRVEGLADTQPVREELIMGPPSRVAFDANGNPSKAAEGFARTNHVSVPSLEKVATGKGEYLAVRVKRGGASASDVLSSLAPAVIAALPFPKRMRWGDGDFAFARPIRWIVALLDGSVVPFTVGAVSSGRETFGHREHGYGPFSLGTPDEYDTVMAEAGVVPSGGDRRKVVVEGGDRQVAGIGGHVIWKDALLDEVCGLAEHPVPMLGDFDRKYLDLPREVLLTSMETHQKSFGIQDGQGRLVPHFLTVLNITPIDMDVVKKGWERVLRARLEDARFFWENDLASSFDAWLAKLDDVIFLAPLGSMGDKTRRISALCEWLARNVHRVDGVGGDYVDSMEAGRAGRISKADLVSEMVGEFDTLQGVMGGIYARKMDEPLAVASALAEQYLPSGPDSPVPVTDLGAVLSMADKADTLVGCFGLNMIPSGTADQYALRRAALGIARILLERQLTVDMPAFFAYARAQYKGVDWKLGANDAQAKLLDFFAARVKNLFLTRGHDTLMVEAVAGTGASDVWSVSRKLEALEAFSTSSDFEKAVQTFKRVGNIIRKQAGDEALSGVVDDALLVDDVERRLVLEVRTAFDDRDGDSRSVDYQRILSSAARLRPFVDAFFGGVMVMCEDIATRRNRLNILKSIAVRVGQAADFSALQM